MGMTGRSAEQEASIPRSRYFEDHYFSPDQWMSMRAQVDWVRRLDVATVLEIGIGNGIVTAILRHCGFRVTTVDINPSLNPDVIGSVERLGGVLAGRQFDLVLCAEVLEHLPFALFGSCLESIWQCTARWAVVTLPSSGRMLLFLRARLPKGLRVDVNLQLPRQWHLPRTACTPSAHHWEISSVADTALSRITQSMMELFDVRESARIVGHPTHRLFVLEKRTASSDAPGPLRRLARR